MKQIRLRYLAEVNPPTPQFDRLRGADEVCFLPLEAVWSDARLDLSRRRPWQDVSTGYVRFAEGDILSPKVTPTFQAGRSAIVSRIPGGAGAATTEVHVLRARPGLADPRYVRYALLTKRFLEEGMSRFQGVAGLQRVPDDFLRDFQVTDRPFEEQRRIADFLDDQTSRIDGIVSGRTQMIDLIDERAKSEIQCLVLGRVDGGPRSDPGGPVLPAPVDWGVRRNKTFLREVVDLSESGEEEMLTVSHLTGVTPRSEKTVYMFEAETNEGYKRVRPGDLVINTLWAWMGALGVAHQAGIVSPAYGIYRITDPNATPAYFDALFRSAAYVSEMTRYSKGVWSSRLRLYPESFLALRSPFPQPEVQRSIAVHVSGIARNAEAMRQPLKSSIALLQERKRSLITAAVTGEFDVSSASPRAADAVVSG